MIMNDTPDNVTPITPDSAPENAPENAPQQMEALKLGDEFDTALLGATIRGQFAYSLSQLTVIAVKQRGISVPEAQEFVAQQVIAITRANGDAAPVFIDDWVLAQAAIEQELAGEKKVEIAVLGQHTPSSEGIAIPGRNHGAVKGFLDPKGLKS
jgi:hypothetical protein